jgi:hypothetical protein
MIKKVKEGYQVLSSKGKNLGGPYKTLEEAKKRLRQIEFFKHRKMSSLRTGPQSTLRNQIDPRANRDLALRRI